MHNDHCVRTVHAEVNAISQCASDGIATLGSTLYVNTFPCWDCFKVIASAKVRRVVYDADYRNNERVTHAAHALGIRLDAHRANT